MIVYLLCTHQVIQEIYIDTFRLSFKKNVFQESFVRYRTVSDHIAKLFELLYLHMYASGNTGNLH